MIGLGKERLPNSLNSTKLLILKSISYLFIDRLFNYYLFVITLSGIHNTLYILLIITYYLLLVHLRLLNINISIWTIW